MHHILIEGLRLTNFNQSLQRVGISTKCPAWNWVVRFTTIENTGTGRYFGDFDGSEEFANLLIEHNYIHDTIGYNAQFKHQHARTLSLGIPATATTIIRHNVFSKATGSSMVLDDARTNLLVGHWPLSGPGSQDTYQIYGNFFYQNPTVEALFQGEGNIALHDNLFVNRVGSGAAVWIQAHNSVPRKIDVFNNTVVATEEGISISGADTTYEQRVVGNAVFATYPLYGGQQSHNVTGSYNAAMDHLNNPMADPGYGLDLFPKSGQLYDPGTPIDHEGLFADDWMDWNRDFNKKPRLSAYRGAYSGDGVNPGWGPALAIKAWSTNNVLQNGVPFSGIAAAQYGQKQWTMNVPPGMTNLQFQTTGGTGNGNLYVRFGEPPTTSSYGCASTSANNNESCSFSSPSVGTWYVMLYGAAAYSGVTITGSYCNSIAEVEPNDSTTAPQVISGPCNQISGTFLNDAPAQQGDYFRVNLPAGRTVTALLDGLTANYDLHVFRGSDLVTSANAGTTPEQASWTNTTASAVDVFVLVWRRASSAQAAYQLKVSY